MAMTVAAPIFVIGSHRSGTTLLARSLGNHPEVDYWEEPRQLWSWRHNYRRDDVLTAEHATQRIRAHISRAFVSHLEASGRRRVVEKTPSNCLRLGFIHAIFPDALFVHIARDGRAVVHSTRLVVENRFPERRFYAQRLVGTPVWEWPALVPRAVRTVARRVLGKRMSYWGPRPAGWQSWLRHDSPMVVLAKQWRYTVEPVLDLRTQLPPTQWLDLRYEQVVTEPTLTAERLLAFTGLAPSARFVEHLVRQCDPQRIDSWRTAMDASTLREIRPILEPPMISLGYRWDAAPSVSAYTQASDTS